MSNLYEVDFYSWAMAQADAARRRSVKEVDWDNVAEELESLGKAEARELYSRYIVLLTHLLKWIHQPAKRSKSWLASIAIQRKMLARHIRQNPGLKPKETEEFLEAYGVARLRAHKETRLEIGTFPEAPPFTLDQAKDDAWLPE